MENNEKYAFEYNRDILLENVDIHPDDMRVLDISINEMVDAGVGIIKEITFADNNAYNWIMHLTNEENDVFYLELSEHGSVVQLRKNDIQGEMIINYICTGDVDIVQ